MDLRPYQIDVAQQAFDKWTQGIDNLLVVLPTGSGKTVVKSFITKQRNEPTMAIAHRQELVLQISESLARFGIHHRVIAPTAVQKYCAHRHMKLFGTIYVEANAKVSVAGVQTLLRRQETLGRYFRQIKFWDVDEAHHLQPENQWGKAVDLFPNAQGLGVTATPLRCDRRGLDGNFQDMIIGPGMREMITDGYLSEYRIFCPPASIDRAGLRVSPTTGEFQQEALRQTVARSTITGDIMDHYQRLTPGKSGLTFCVDVDTAEQTAEAFRQAGVPALMLHGGSTDAERTDGLDALKRGDIKMITNVDLFGEGFDCPALEVVHMGRPTQSYGLYVQQFGRVIRPLEGKTHGIVIDHVGNVVTHGLPDAPRQWTLEGRRQQEADPDDVPIRACPSCLQPFQAYHILCPHCGYKPEPAARTTPREVDGDLEELDPAVLARMRGEVINIDSGAPAIPYNAPGAVVGRKTREWGELCDAQRSLREVISYVAGAWHFGDGLSDREIHRRFYLAFQITILEACALRRAEAVTLTSRLREYLT